MNQSTSTNNHGLFLHLVIGILYLDGEDAGFDLTVRLRCNKKEIEVGGEWFNIVDVIHVEGILRGRATVCYHVEKDGKDYVVKDSWVDISRNDRGSRYPGEAEGT